jgi:hypothetical protein
MSLSFMIVVLRKRIPPDIVNFFDVNASSHHFEHHLLGWNVDDRRTILGGIPRLWVAEQRERTHGLFLGKWV